MFQTFDSESDPSVGRERVGRLREWLAAAKPRRLPGAALRPASGRVCRAGLGAAALADRLCRLGRRRADPARAGAISSSTAATRCRCAARSTCRSSPSRAWSRRRRPPGSARIWARARASASIRGCIRSPTPRRCGAAAEKAGATLVPVDRNPIDQIWADRPAPPLAKVADPSDRICRRARQGQAGPACRGARQGGRRAHRADRYRVGRLGLQHPRQRRAAYAGGAGLRRAVGRRAASAVHRPAQAGHRDRRLSDAARRPAARRARSTREIARLAAGGARIGARPGAGRRASARAGRGERRHGRRRLPIRPACRAPPRTRPRSPARAPRTAATARRSPRCWPGSTARCPARSTRSPPSRSSRNSAG